MAITATDIKEIREPGVTNQVTAATVGPDAHVFWVTPVGSLDQTMPYSELLQYLRSSTGAVLDVAADGLRVSGSALGAGLTGGGASTIGIDLQNLTTETTLGDTDLIAFYDAVNGDHRNIAVSDLRTEIGTGDLTGDVTSVGLVTTISTSAVTEAKIADNAVSNGKLADVKEYSLKGRATAGSGDPADLDETDITVYATPNAGDHCLGWTSTGLLRRFNIGNLHDFIDHTGDVGSNGLTTSITAGAVTWNKIQDTSAESVLIGRGQGSGAGDVQEITLGSNLTLTGTVLDATGGGSSNPQVFRLVGSGTPATDDAAFNALVTSLNTAGVPATIEIEGEVFVTTPKAFTAPISLRGVPGKISRINSQVTSGVVLDWHNINVDSLPAYSATTQRAFDERVTSPNYALSEGEWFLTRSENAISGVPPHYANGIQLPMELHQCYEWDQANTNAYTTTAVVDQITAAAEGKIIPLTMHTDITVADLEFVFSGTPPLASFTTLLKFEAINHLLVRDCRLHRRGPGAISFGYCANVIVDGLIIEGAEDPDQAGIYGVVIGACNGVRIVNSTISGTRHAITTTSGAALNITDNVESVDTALDTLTLTGHQFTNDDAVKINQSGGAVPGGLSEDTVYWVTNATASTLQLAATPGGTEIDLTSTGSGTITLYRSVRWGTPLNVLVENCTINCQPGTGQRSACHTHAEGFGLTFKDCTINIVENNVGGLVVARRTTFDHCYFLGDWAYPAGAGVAAGVRVYGSQCAIRYCTFDGMWTGVQTFQGSLPTKAYADDCVIEHNTFLKIRGAPIQHRDAGNNLLVAGNTFGDCGRADKRACIDFDETLQNGSGHRIEGNTFAKRNNLYTVHLGDLTVGEVSIVGNVCTGYGAQWLGLTHDVAATASTFNGQFLHQNQHDDGPYGNGLSGAAFTVNWNNGPLQSIVLNANCTLTFSAPPRAGELLLMVTQDPTGGRSISWPPLKGGGYIVATQANEVSICRFFYDGSVYHTQV